MDIIMWPQNLNFSLCEALLYAPLSLAWCRWTWCLGQHRPCLYTMPWGFPKTFPMCVWRLRLGQHKYRYKCPNQRAVSFCLRVAHISNRLQTQTMRLLFAAIAKWPIGKKADSIFSFSFFASLIGLDLIWIFLYHIHLARFSKSA